ncbi:MAG TPA: OmpA family protein [Geobacteraceae bacterium]
MPGKVLIAGLVILVPLSGHAAVIKQRPFAFSHEIVVSQQSDAFVVCSGCPDDRLTLLPAPPRLAARLSMTEPQPARTQVKEPEANSKTGIEKRCASCLLGTVHFPFDSAEITQGERTRLDELIRGIKAGNAVGLEGYTCDLGSSAHNMGLSLRRVQGVAAYLKGKGISVGKVEGLGKCCPVSGDRRLNRRVEISTERKEEK